MSTAPEIVREQPESASRDHEVGSGSALPGGVLGRLEGGEHLLVPALLGAVMFAVALSVLPSVPGRGDSAELTIALAVAGVPHPTGYPLYVLLGHPFALLLHRLGWSWPAAANAWSAAAAALAVALHARLGLELVRVSIPRGAAAGLPARWLAAITPALAMVFHPVWLTAATQAEVYAMWYALSAAAALFALQQVVRLAAAGDSLESRGRAHAADSRAACTWGFLCAASAAHHLIAGAMLLPLTAALVVALARSGRWRVSLLGAWGAGALLPLAAYGFVAYRTFHPAPYQWPIDPSWAGVWRHVSGSMYVRYVGEFAPRGEELEMIRGAVAPFLVTLPIVGVWALSARSAALRSWLMASLLGAALLAGFVFLYGVPDPAAYFGPVLMLGSLVAVPLLLAASRRGLGVVATALVLVGVAAPGRWSLDRSVRERDRLEAADREIRSAWQSIPFDRGIVLWLGDRCARLEILRLLEHRRSDLCVINPNLLTWPVSRALFFRRFGFDPLDHAYANYWEELPSFLREQTGLPVVEFTAVLGGRYGRDPLSRAPRATPPAGGPPRPR